MVVDDVQEADVDDDEEGKKLREEKRGNPVDLLRVHVVAFPTDCWDIKVLDSNPSSGTGDHSGYPCPAPSLRRSNESEELKNVVERYEQQGSHGRGKHGEKTA